MGKRRRIIVSDSESEADSDDSFIVRSDEEGGEADSDDSFLVRSDEEEGEEDEEEEEEEEEDAYLPKEEMRKKYKKNPKLGEPPGYVESREHKTQLTADETWTHITNSLCTDAARRKCGLVPLEHGGIRLLTRFNYGTNDLSSWNRDATMGSYERILVPLVEKLFCQKAYQPPPDSCDEMPKYAFNGWKQHLGSHTNDLGDIDRDLWCICCQNYTRNQLATVQIMQHEKSGIYLLTGGDCARFMRGMASREEADNLCPVTDAHDKQKQFRMIVYGFRL